VNIDDSYNDHGKYVVILVAGALCILWTASGEHGETRFDTVKALMRGSVFGHRSVYRSYLGGRNWMRNGRRMRLRNLEGRCGQNSR
jgi:hypothetical protein